MILPYSQPIVIKPSCAVALLLSLLIGTGPLALAEVAPTESDYSDFTLPTPVSVPWAEPSLPPKTALPPKQDQEVTLKAGIIKTLPEELYGTWNILTKLTRFDGPPYFPVHQQGSEIWALGETHSEISIENVVNGAYASISVDEVIGKTATFHHTAGSVESGLVVVEIPTVTVNGNHLSGVNRQTLNYYRFGKLAEVIQIEQEIEGERLKDTPYQFKTPIKRSAQGKPLFDVEPMQKDLYSPFLDR